MLVRLLLPPGLERQPLEVLPPWSRLVLPLLVSERACLGFGASQRLPPSWRPSFLLLGLERSSVLTDFAPALAVPARPIRSVGWWHPSQPQGHSGPHGALGWLVVSRCGLEPVESARCRLSGLFVLIDSPTEALTLGGAPSPLTTRPSDETTPGPRTAPASPPTRSSRLAARRRRRRCGSGMRLRSPKPPETSMSSRANLRNRARTSRCARGIGSSAWVIAGRWVGARHTQTPPETERRSYYGTK